jgi:hypothetical protein
MKTQGKRQFRSDELITKNSKSTHFYSNDAILIKQDLDAIAEDVEGE